MPKIIQPELRSIIDLMMNVAHWVKKSQFVSFQNSQLHRRELQALWLIARSNQNFSSQTLATKLAITPGAVTQLIDQLVEKGLVLRQLDETDRRKSQLIISESAEKHLRELKTKHLASLAPIFLNLSNSELHELKKLLTKLSLPIKADCKAA